MKTLLLSTLLLFVTFYAGSAVAAGGAKDTIIIRMKKGDKMMLITRPGQGGRASLKEYDINKILSQVDSTLSQTSSTTMISGRDTTYIVRRGTSVAADSGKRRQVSLNVSYKRGTTVIVKEVNEEGDTIVKAKKRNKTKDRSNFYVNLGLNNWLYKGAGKVPASEGDLFSLSPLGSRFVALGYSYKLPIGKSPFGIKAGLEIAWNNYMFSKDLDRRLVKVDSGLNPGPGFTLAQADNLGRRENIIKSKLVACNLRLPVMLTVNLGRGFSAEVGGYGGYLLDSYTKVKYTPLEGGSNKKDRKHSNYYLNSLQYGLRAQLNRNDLGVFFEYGLNSVFSKGPDLRSFQFGIRII